MRAADAFGVALTIVFVIWVVGGNLSRNGGGRILLSLPHPRRLVMICSSIVIAVLLGVDFYTSGTMRLPWGMIAFLIFYTAIRPVEFRETGIFANPSFYEWDDIESARWARDTLIVKSRKRFVSPRTLTIELDAEDRAKAAEILETYTEEQSVSDDGEET